MTAPNRRSVPSRRCWRSDESGSRGPHGAAAAGRLFTASPPGRPGPAPPGTMDRHCCGARDPAAAAGATWRSLHVVPRPSQVVTEAPPTASQAVENIASVSSAPGWLTRVRRRDASHVSGGIRPKPSRPAVRSGRQDAPAVKPAAFIALPGAASLPTFESGSIVRMDLELSALVAFGVDISAAGRKKSGPGRCARRPGRRTSRHPGRHQFLGIRHHLHGADNEKSCDRR